MADVFLLPHYHWVLPKGAFEAAVAYSKERKQFGQPISNFQGIAFKLADMATEIEAAELLIMQAADLKNRHLPVTKQSAMAKYLCIRSCGTDSYRSCTDIWRLWLYQRFPG